MKKQEKIYRSLTGLTVITALLLSVPLVAMQFTSEVSWSIVDFLIMGLLIFCTGLSYIILSRQAPNVIYRIAIGFTIAVTFLMIWANLAVGLIGSGPNAANLMYIGVVCVVVTGISLARFKPAGLVNVMYATILALLLHTAVVLLAGLCRSTGGSVTELLSVNGFFSGLFLISALLFRYATKQRTPQRAQ